MSTTTDAPVFVGIDVSKASLDVHLIPGDRSFSLPNDAPGSATLVERVTPLNVKLVVVEATGRYKRRVAADLLIPGDPLSPADQTLQAPFTITAAKLVPWSAACRRRPSRMVSSARRAGWAWPGTSWPRPSPSPRGRATPTPP